MRNSLEKRVFASPPKGIFSALAMAAALFLVKPNQTYATPEPAPVPQMTTSNTIVVDSTYNLQEVIDGITTNSIILLQDGVYTVPREFGLQWDGNEKHLTIKSENGPTNCIIDCRKNGEEEGSGRAFTFDHSNQTLDDVIDGIKIVNGRTVTDFVSIYEDSIGGGAIMIYDSAATINNCIFEFNHANDSPAGALADGGAIYVLDGKANISSSTFFQNIASHGGGAIHFENSEVNIDQSEFIENIAYACTGGGAIGAMGNSSGRIRNCLIKGNNSRYYSRGGYGGGIGILNANPDIMNCTIIYNSTIHPSSTILGHGGAIKISGKHINPEKPYPNITNCIFYGNESTSDSMNISFRYPDESPSIDKILPITYTFVENGIGDIISTHPETLIYGDPRFVDPENGDYRVQSNSPCIAAGVNLPDLRYDIEGNPRSLTHPTIGAYESQITTPVKRKIWTLYKD